MAPEIAVRPVEVGAPTAHETAAWADAAERLTAYRAGILRACGRHGAQDVDVHGIVVLGPRGPEPDLMLVIHDQLSEDELQALRRDLAVA